MATKTAEIPGGARSFGRRQIIAIVKLWLKRRQILKDFRAVRALPDHRLRDLGLSRDDIDWAEGRARIWLDLDSRP